MRGFHSETGLSGRWRCGRWVAGNGWKKTRTTGQTTSRIRISLQHPPSVPHKGEQPNIQDQAVNCVNSGKSQGDCYCEQAKVRSRYLEEETSQLITTQLLWFGHGDWLKSKKEGVAYLHVTLLKTCIWNRESFCSWEFFINCAMTNHSIGVFFYEKCINVG